MSNDPIVTGAPLGRAGRIALVGGGLMVASGIFGAIVGAIAFSAGAAIVMHMFGWSVIAWGAARGAVMGGIVAPLGSYVFLRRVPLGLAIPGLTLGTILGGTAGELVPHPLLGEWQSAIGAAVGFVVAAILLRLRSTPPAKQSEATEE